MAAQASKIRTVAGLVLLFAIVAYVLFGRFAKLVQRIERGDKPDYANAVYFYDLDKGELTHAPKGSLDTIVRDGRTLVRAYVFACGECPDEIKDENIHYLRRVSVEALAKYEAAQSLEDKQQAIGHLGA